MSVRSKLELFSISISELKKQVIIIKSQNNLEELAKLKDQLDDLKEKFKSKFYNHENDYEGDEIYLIESINNQVQKIEDMLKENPY